MVDIGRGKSKFRVKLDYDEDGGWWTVQCVDLPSAISQGRTKREALRNIREAIRAVVEERLIYEAGKYRETAHVGRPSKIEVIAI